MQCPVCQDSTLVMSERQGIEIDYCPRCRGVWLDRGELDKIIARSTADIQQQPVPVHGAASAGQHAPRSAHHDDRYAHKRRKGFWEDLFD